MLEVQVTPGGPGDVHTKLGDHQEVARWILRGTQDQNHVRMHKFGVNIDFSEPHALGLLRSTGCLVHLDRDVGDDVAASPHLTESALAEEVSLV